MFYSLHVIIVDLNKKKVHFLTSGYGKNNDIRIHRNSNNLQNYVEYLQENIGMFYSVVLII